MTEENFLGRAVHVHATAGDIGTVQDVDDDDGWVTVTWARVGTTTICHPSEYEPLNAAADLRSEI